MSGSALLPSAVLCSAVAIVAAQSLAFAQGGEEPPAGSAATAPTGSAAPTPATAPAEPQQSPATDSGSDQHATATPIVPSNQSPPPSSPRPEYPETQIDRPLLLYAGMIWIDISEDFYTYNTTTVNAMGSATTSTNWNREPDIGGGYSLGLAQLTGRLVGNALIGSIAVQAGSSGDVYASYEYDFPQPTYRYSHIETVAYTHKLVIVPHRFAVYPGANMQIVQESLTPAMAPPSAGTLFSAYVGAGAVVQLARRLALSVGTGVGIPVAQSESLLVTFHTALSGYVQVQQTLHHWDFYANVNFSDITHGFYPFVSVGFLHRWRG